MDSTVTPSIMVLPVNQAPIYLTNKPVPVTDVTTLTNILTYKFKKTIFLICDTFLSYHSELNRKIEPVAVS